MPYESKAVLMGELMEAFYLCNFLKVAFLVTVRLKGTTHISEKIISSDKWWSLK